jgi:Xaa-Pro aminopeptidase
MKKYFSLLVLLTIITGCNQPESRSWIVPVTIDTSDLIYTPEKMESYEYRQGRLREAMVAEYMILRSSDFCSYNRHEFRPNNYFYYITGYSAPGCYAILSRDSADPYVLSLPPLNVRSMIYEGEPPPADEIKAIYGPHRLLTSQDAIRLIDSILSLGRPVYADLDNRSLMDELEYGSGNGNGVEFLSAAELLDEMRVIKGSVEVERIQKACNITARALTRVMDQCRPGQYEFEVESVIEGTFRDYGAAMPGFSSIVGSGPNTTILHYEKNSRRIENGDLLLMDVGAEYGYYTADMTRTIPVNGRFSREQRIIYQLVLDAQLAAIEVMKPGHGFMEGHMAAKKVIVDGLTRLGLITDPGAPWQARFYMPHLSSHYLGLDVHDVGNMGGSFEQFMEQASGDSVMSRKLEPGMVLTIEPGVYFREKGLEQLFWIFQQEADSTEIADFVEQVREKYEKYINIGVRIEDDILITREGNIILSRYAPREIEDIEQLMR